MRTDLAARDPWRELTLPTGSGEVNRRRVDAAHPLDCFAGVASDGRRMFWLRWDAPMGAGDRTPEELPSLAGLDMRNVRDGASDAWRLELSVQCGADIDLLRVLAGDLMETTADLDRSAGYTGMLGMCERLWRWHRLMKAAAADVLGLERQIGLYGELLFIEGHLLTHFSPSDALKAWRGPFGAPRDFDLGTFEFELKTLAGPIRDAVEISSLDQLDASNASVFLGCCRLLAERDGPGDTAANSKWRSLNELVGSLRERLRRESLAALTVLDGCLLEAGWVARAEYDRQRWRNGGLRLWRIDPTFPMLGRRDIRPEITAAYYTLDLARCDAWRVDSLPLPAPDHDGR